MSKQEKPKSKITLSKTSKRMASTIVDSHQRGEFIRRMLEAENAAYMSRFTKPGKDSGLN